MFAIRGSMPGAKLDEAHDEFVREIIRRMEATTIGTTLRTRHGSVSLTDEEKCRLDRIAKTKGLSAEQLIDEFSEDQTR